ncbi:hypothetical protein KUL118_28300 [Tenacibaculum sp. KUL118]|nr:hypothetical protein KUL118_28300 [Tenacibaculum sp. KUL118]
MKLSRWCPLVASISAVFLSTMSTSVLANDDWWFDVEVIAFKRNVALTELEEQFSLADNLSAPRAQADLISDIIAPDISYLKQGLPICGADNAVKWADNPLLHVPPSDVDFLSLRQSIDATQTEGQQKPSPLPFETATDSVTDNEISANAVDGINDFDNVDDSFDDISPAPDAQTIASYWTAFFGVTRTSPVTVPAFKYCEDDKPWLSAEVTTAVVAAAATNKGNDDSTGLPSVVNTTLQPAIVWKVNKPDNRMPAPAALPIIIEGHDWPLASKAHLLTSNEQALASISRQIRSNRDLERLFHTTWRQPVMFGKNNAFDVRVYGGQNYAQQFNLNGEMRTQSTQSAEATMPFALSDNALVDNEFQLRDESQASVHNGSESGAIDEYVKPSEDYEAQEQQPSKSELVAVSDIFAELEMRLANPSPIAYDAFKALDKPLIVEQSEEGASDVAFRTPIWEIDGTIKVFLKYINRVPYLHIDSEMFYRQPVPLSYFGNQAVNVNQGSNENDSRAANDSASQTYKLVSVPLIEQRRVISTQLHYFDHPLFGFVVQVRRYNRPAESEQQ